ncbi:MAG TPA: NAD-dependent epimerase/dehydratase family protein [Candidatus Eisenbacteria bacterium]|nr:NAD-dependent epimerase/dehydratase family protein [Candidatus Eisenbacteria bacterium]
MPNSRKKEKVLVTGGAGFIGSQLAGRLVRLGYRVTVVDDLSTGRRSYVPKEAAFHKMNIAGPAVSRLIEREKPVFVFHLAAQIDLRASVKDPVMDAETNIHGSLRVLEGCRRAGVKKIIFSSSGGAMYGSSVRIPSPETAAATPTSPYGVAKLAFELYLRSAHRTHGQRYAALRYANVYGPRQDLRGEAGVIGIFTQKFLAGGTPTIFGDGKQTRDFVFVDDVVNANIRAMRSTAVGVFNIGTGRESSVNRVAALIAEEAGWNGRIPHGPANAGEERRSALDSRLARRVLGWRPMVRLEDGIARTVAWFREKK